MVTLLKDWRSLVTTAELPPTVLPTHVLVQMPGTCKLGSQQRGEMRDPVSELLHILPSLKRGSENKASSYFTSRRINDDPHCVTLSPLGLRPMHSHAIQ